MDIAKLLNNNDLLKAIDCYIIKADEELEEELNENGIVDTAAAIAFLNALEDSIIDIEDNIVQDITSNLKSDNIVTNAVCNVILDQIKNTEYEVQYADMLHDRFTEFFEDSVKACSKNIDKDIVITEYTMKSKSWLAEWAHNLAEILKTQNEEAVFKILESCNDGESTIKDTERLIVDLGIRGEGSSSRQLATTETYRVNNYAKEEAFIQNPSVTGKEWVHSGSRKNARKYHLALDGVVIPVNEKFKLKGVKGGTYSPMIPHDTGLPVEEVKNCKCKIEYRTSKEILNKNADEKAKEQKKRIRESDTEWEKEFNARNKKASGIDFEKVKIDWVKNKSTDEQIKYFGGGHSGKARKALLDSGIIKTDKDLQQLYKRSEKGKRQLKTLKELEDSGIITVREKALTHSVLGTYKPKSKEYPNGRLFTGGHSFKSIGECKNKGIKCSVLGEYSNGVKFGNVPTAKLKENRYSGGHTWFPEKWTDDDILNAGTFVANNPKIDNGYEKIGIYNGIAVRVLMTDKTIDSIHPVKNQSMYIKGVDLK